jgi:hypothetical protein
MTVIVTSFPRRVREIETLWITLGDVGQLLRQVLVGQDAVGVARSPLVDPDAGVAVAGDPRIPALPPARRDRGP